MCGREDEDQEDRTPLSLAQTRDPGNDITDWVQGMKKEQTRKGRIRGESEGGRTGIHQEKRKDTQRKRKENQEQPKPDDDGGGICIESLH